MARWTRRRLLWIGGVGAAALVGLGGLRFGLPLWLRPGRPRSLSEGARAFVARCLDGIDPTRYVDGHVHLLGLGTGGTGCWIHEGMQSHLHPVQRFQFDLYRSAVGMTDPETADKDYVERLLALHRASIPEGRLLLLAFDMVVDESGQEHPDRSAFYTPDGYVLRLTAEHPELTACASIHPYRADAVERLDQAAEGGARAVKWLPTSMGIDPASPLCGSFYRRLAELGLPLLTHGGTELAVASHHDQELGNPLRLRRALDAGVRVVVAHCASVGTLRDTDAPGDQRRDAFGLFMRLFTDARYERNLYGDVSALAMVNRPADTVRELLLAEELHPRLVHGSDYPLPALHFIYSTSKLVLTDLLDEADRRWINEIAEVNPLLFNFVLKRALRVERGGRTYRLAASVFEGAWLY